VQFGGCNHRLFTQVFLPHRRAHPRVHGSNPATRPADIYIYRCTSGSAVYMRQGRGVAGPRTVRRTPESLRPSRSVGSERESDPGTSRTARSARPLYPSREVSSRIREMPDRRYLQQSSPPDANGIGNQRCNIDVWNHP
jgi:hypothetical protein